MIQDYLNLTRKEYENLRDFAFHTAKNTLEYYNASDYSWISDEDIDDILNTLKQDDRTVFTMDRDGYTPAETAEYLNISTQNTYTKLCRIKQKISKSLAA